MIMFYVALPIMYRFYHMFFFVFYIVFTNLYNEKALYSAKDMWKQPVGPGLLSTRESPDWYQICGARQKLLY